MEEDEGEVRSAFKKSSGRRRSSFGGAGKSPSSSNPLNAAEQARIAEMYKTVISLATGDKLTAKNAWDYDLIDQMGNIIKADEKGVNFQKASCTLDASIKIYSNRVDDTYQSHHRILESLSRNGSNTQEEETPTENGKTKARVGSKGTSSRLNISETIERNPSNINAVTHENDYSVDPLFHKMSKAFDEGGAKGMLMYNMRLSKGTSTLSFKAEGIGITNYLDSPEATSTSTSISTSSNDQINIGDLIFKSNINLPELSRMDICPQLEVYRDQIGIISMPSDFCSFPAWIDSTSFPSPSNYFVDNEQQQQVSEGEGGGHNHNQDIGDYYDDDAGGGGDDDYYPDGGENDDEPCFPPNEAGDELAFMDDNALAGDNEGAPVSVNPRRYSSSNNQKIDWVTSSDTADINEDNMEVIQQGIDNLMLTGSHDYTFFDTNALTKGNAWAGARHWKYAAKRREAAELTSKRSSERQKAALLNSADSTETAEVNSTPSTSNAKGSTEKGAPVVVFTVEGVEEGLLELPTSGQKTDATLLKGVKGDASVAKESLFLPLDAKVEVKDLYRLYLVPKLVVPPPSGNKQALMLAMQKKSITSKFKDMFSAEGSDQIWGQATVQLKVDGVPRNGAVAFNGELGGYGENDDYGDDYDDDGGGGGDDYYDDDDHDQDTTEAMDGLTIDKNSLLKATRTVAKIEIGYEQVSKRVNIQRLKTDIWKNIRSTINIEKETDIASSLRSESTEQGENENSDPNAMSSIKAATKRPRDTNTNTNNEDLKSGKASLSFQDMISEVASRPRQKDVSMSFYFICLLHLANENSLRIEDCEDMTDLRISTGTV